MDSSKDMDNSHLIRTLLSSVTTLLHRPVVTSAGRFRNPWSTWKDISIWKLLKFLFFSKNNSNVPSASALDRTLPLVLVNPETVGTPPPDGIRVTWLGHATVLVQFDGISVLTDPVFSERVSPFPFMGPKRYRPVPAEIQDLPPSLEAVVISHNHYDHLDYKTVQSLNERYGSKLHWFVPKGVERWMRERGCETVTELSWWDVASYKGASFILTPAQHWCRRNVRDTNRCLWGSWCVVVPRHRFFFAGDTGYCEGFKQIGAHIGPFDLAAIPIGAYEPRWMMTPQHVDPKEAVKIHQDVRAQRSVGIHWGTFALAHEFYLEPPEKLKKESEAAGLQPETFFVMKHGESRVVSKLNNLATE